MLVRTVSEYLAVIDAVAREYSADRMRADLIFRGLSCFEHSLLPGIYRRHAAPGAQGGTPDYQASEGTILHHFIKNAMSQVDHIGRDDILTWLTYAQHFGAPTRLMDFSANPLISLYFSCKKEFGYNGAVCILHEGAYVNTLQLNAVPGKKKRDVMSEIAANVLDPAAPCTRYPVTLIPHYIDRRMEAQSSRFLVWGQDRAPFEDIAKPHGSMLEHAPDAFFCKIPIDGNAKPALLRELSFLGVNEKKMFPGLDGIGKYVAEYYRICKT